MKRFNKIMLSMLIAGNADFVVFAMENPNPETRFLQISLTPKGIQQCPICLGDFDNAPVMADEVRDYDIVITTCGHYFHRHCLVDCLERNNICPSCRSNLAPRSQHLVNRLVAWLRRHDMCSSCISIFEIQDTPQRRYFVNQLIAGQQDAAAALHAERQEAGQRLDQLLGQELISCACYGDAALIRDCITSGAEVDSLTVSGHTPLHIVAKSGHSECVRTLLEARANPNASSFNGLTPLHFAIANGHTDCARILLEARANPNARGCDGSTPLHFATENGHTDCVSLLITAGANVNAVDNNDDTPLHLARREVHVECVMLLEQAGAKTYITYQ